MKNRLTPDRVETLVHQLERETTRAGRTGVINNAMADYSITYQAIWKAVKKAGYNSGRKTRTDFKAVRKSAPGSDPEVIKQTMQRIAALIHESRTQKGTVPLASWNAIHMAIQNRYPHADLVTPNMMNDYMRKGGMSKADALRPTPHIRMRTEYSNEVHQLDCSAYAAFYLGNNGKLKKQTPGFDSGYKNKAGKGPEITRYIVSDHCSGAFYVGYAAGPENARDALHFLYLAWAGRLMMQETESATYLSATQLLLTDPTLQLTHTPGTAVIPSSRDSAPLIQNSEFRIQNFSAADCPPQPCALHQFLPFHGRPEMLYTDNGSSWHSTLFQSVLTKLGIRHETHKPGNPRAKGANEGLQGIWERAFETRMRFNPPTTLQELNARAIAFCAWFCAERPVRRHKMPRTMAWLKFLANRPVQLMPHIDLYRAMATLPRQDRKCGPDGYFTLAVPRQMKDVFGTGSITYKIADTNAWGRDIQIRPDFYRYPSVIAFCPHTNLRYECEPQHFDTKGFILGAAHLGKTFKRPVSTDTQRALADLATIEHTAGAGIVRRETPAGNTPEQVSRHQHALEDARAAEPRITHLIQEVHHEEVIERIPAEGQAEPGTGIPLPPPVGNPSAPANSEFRIQNSELQFTTRQPAFTATAAIIHTTPYAEPMDEEELGPMAGGKVEAKAEVLRILGVRSIHELAPHQVQYIVTHITDATTRPQAQQVAAYLKTQLTHAIPVEGVSL